MAELQAAGLAELYAAGLAELQAAATGKYGVKRGTEKVALFFRQEFTLGGNSLNYDHPQAAPAQATTAQAITAHVPPQIMTSKWQNSLFHTLSSLQNSEI